MTEQEQIKEAFEDLLKSLRKETSKENRQKIKEAFEFANEAHKGVKRRSGEPYILHPLAVAKIAVKEIGLGTTSVISALLHDVVEDTDYTVEDIANLFGPKVASIVDGLTKISGVMGSDTSRQAESFRKMILTLADDVRVILIKIADRLHNMRTLDALKPEKQIKIATQSLKIYAPLAGRLGLSFVKCELEDLAMRYLYPDDYYELVEFIKTKSKERQQFIEKICDELKAKLQELGIEGEVNGRQKHLYGIYKKMLKHAMQDHMQITTHRHIVFPRIVDAFAERPSSRRLGPRRLSREQQETKGRNRFKSVYHIRFAL